ncbi:MAG: hypothetical protein NC489_34995 [Ruminococcus flavefaciens]|nr:hypothetical protein [Ruminococcus flavefaciens]
MNNTELFNFKFVNRINERKVLHTFLNHEMENNILWINGASGVGKTYFIEKNILDNKRDGDVVVYINKFGEASTSYIYQFINILSESSTISFYQFIKANYVSIFDAVKKITVNILVSNSINDFGLIESGFDLTKQFLTKGKEHHNIIKVIDNYLKYISRNSKALIILDNFTLCDEESLDVFSSVLYNHQANKNLQFIVVTTSELLKERVDILSLLSEKINLVRISLYPFTSSTYFFDILNDLFDLSHCEWDDIKRLHEVSKGLPQKLKIFLMNLYSQNGIDYQKEKAIFIYDKLRNLLQEELIDFDFNSLPVEQRYVLQLATEWGMPIKLTILNELSTYIANIDTSLQEFSESILRKALLDLENLGILEKTYENNVCQIKVKHDSIYYAVSRLIKENIVKSRFIHFCMLQFIKINHDILVNDDLYFLEAYHSFLAKADGWQQVNVKYGLNLAKEKQYIKAQKVLDRLSEYIQELSPIQKLSIAQNAYNAGEYQKAESILNLLQANALNNNEVFLLQTTKCRIYMILLDYSKAVESINQLLDDYVEMNSVQRLEALYLKEVALCLTPHKYMDAKYLFEKIIHEYRKEDGLFWMERIYRTSMDYYRGTLSKKYLLEALNICQLLQDDEEFAKATHNLGFECFRCEEYEESFKHFQTCKNILENIKPHETSYCLNNIAVIHMVKQEYDTALDILAEATFWNKSDYAMITISCNKMLCHYYLNHVHEWQSLREYLLNFIKTTPYIDDKIYKKIYTNIAVIAIDQKEYLSAKCLLGQCLPYLKKETIHSSARVKKLLKQLENKNASETPLEDYYKYYCGITFEPWILTFGNE